MLESYEGCKDQEIIEKMKKGICSEGYKIFEVLHSKINLKAITHEAGVQDVFSTMGISTTRESTGLMGVGLLGIIPPEVSHTSAVGICRGFLL